jgi:lipid II:glycine glycyltransferase (peptidoglycan interpeptide bridge formation enzyme)
MKCYQFDPIQEPRWAAFIERHPKASIFHSVAWLNVLKDTYGYDPVVFTTSPPDQELENGLSFCQVNSRLTGNRLVSLPFSDHCELLFDSRERLDFLISNLLSEFETGKWKYLELRPVDPSSTDSLDSRGFAAPERFFLHKLDLRRGIDELFRNLDKDSVQRRVRRAQKANLDEKCGISHALLRDFYRLLVITRRRHRIPPPPYTWFQNLVSHLGGALEIRLAYQKESPVAGILTLRFRNVVYYKYGCSDIRFNHFGAMPWLLWNAVHAAKSGGATEFDLGRTDVNDAGLLAFKNHWDSHPKELVYRRFPEGVRDQFSMGGWKSRVAGVAFSNMPGGVLAFAGKMLYRHFG